jgi:hypothetical protein
MRKARDWKTPDFFLQPSYRDISAHGSPYREAYLHSIAENLFIENNLMFRSQQCFSEAWHAQTDDHDG